MFMFFISNMMMHDYANMWNDKCMENFSFLFLLNAMFMCQILICMNTWMHECMMENLYDFSISFFFLSLFLFSCIFGVNLFSLKSSNPCLFQISFFLLLIFIQHFISEKWGCHKFWSPISKIMFKCLTFSFSTLRHACLIMG